jgi:hypothetical protein
MTPRQQSTLIFVFLFFTGLSAGGDSPCGGEVRLLCNMSELALSYNSIVPIRFMAKLGEAKNPNPDSTDHALQFVLVSADGDIVQTSNIIYLNPVDEDWVEGSIDLIAPLLSRKDQLCSIKCYWLENGETPVCSVSFISPCVRVLDVPNGLDLAFDTTRVAWFELCSSTRSWLAELQNGGKSCVEAAFMTIGERVEFFQASCRFDSHCKIEWPPSDTEEQNQASEDSMTSLANDAESRDSWFTACISSVFRKPKSSYLGYQHFIMVADSFRLNDASYPVSVDYDSLPSTPAYGLQIGDSTVFSFAVSVLPRAGILKYLSSDTLGHMLRGPLYYEAGRKGQVEMLFFGSLIHELGHSMLYSADPSRFNKDDGFDHRAAQHGGLGMDECVLWNLGHHVLGEDLLEEEAPEPRHHISCVANPHFCDRHMEVLERRRSSAK